MCKVKSGIILKDRVFVPEYNHHTNMLEELKIEDSIKNAEKIFVRAELYPKNDDIFSSVDTWIFNVDQDVIPDWFVKEYEEQRMREAVNKWHEKHVFIGVDNLKLSNGTFYIKDCKNAHFSNSTSEHYGNSTSKHYDNSTSEHYGNSTSEHYDNSTSKHYGNSTSEHYDNSTSKHYDNSTSKHYDNSTSEHYGNSTSKHYSNSTSEHWDNSTSILTEYSNNNKENIVLSDNSTLKDCKSKTIYQSGDWKLVLIDKEK
jgi:hypothetical protein